jgi:putative endopeptidase
MEALVANVRKAMASRIQQLEWMGPQTRAAALEKLAALRVRVGYPESWRDYSGLSLDRGDLYGSVQKAAAFHWAFNVARLTHPVDMEEWGMPAYAVDAFANASRVLTGFGAGFLQPPFFDPNADPAVNYGAIGGTIGHEIVHFFDDQGRKYDAKGVLRDWWTPEDAARFEKEADQLARQFDAYEAVPGVRLNGRQTLGENIADLAGVVVALDAYHASLEGRPAPVIDGLTGDQRFFLSWAQNWQAKQREEFLRRAAVEDVHAPPLQRLLGSIRNVDEWYEAFDVKPGDKYYLKPEDRVRIW